MTNPNDPAFVRRQVPKNPPKKDDAVYEHGLTKREYFAAMAMQGMMTHSPEDMLRWADPKDGTVGDWVAINCVQVADAVIRELSK